MFSSRLDHLRDETQSYHSLIDRGGRPSHPISLLEDVVESPGQYRPILSYWQDHPDEWAVFGKQYVRWLNFRYIQQCVRTSGHFDYYVTEAKCNLEDLEITLPFQLEEDLSLQDELAIWIEYLSYEYSIYNWLWRMGDESQYVEAWRFLHAAKVLHPSETYESIRATQSLLGRVQAEDSRGADKGNRFYSNAQKSQIFYVTQFMNETEQYRNWRDNLERCQLLLRWIVEQIPLIEPTINLPKTYMHSLDADLAECIRLDPPKSLLRASRYNSATLLPSLWPKWTSAAFDDDRARCLRDKELALSLDSDKPSIASIFHPFQRLPHEIRFKIWENCLPPRPTVHFFDLINHPLARHHQHLWSNTEFRIRASPDHESGYLHVLSLMGTCKEARTVVTSYYSRLSPGRRTADGKSHSQTSDSNTSTDSQPNLAPFDWIPPDDLVVLCLPPRQSNRFPASHDITLAGRSRVGFAVPYELLDWADIAAAPPLILRDLVSSKLPQMYLLSNMHAVTSPKYNASCFWTQRKVDWIATDLERWTRRMLSWRQVIDKDAVRQRYWVANRESGRSFWCGDDTAVRTPQTDDRFVAWSMLRFVEMVKRNGQVYWEEEFWGTEILGWMVKKSLKSSADLKSESKRERRKIERRKREINQDFVNDEPN